MVRKCIVPNCSSTDITILSHRFPRNQKLAKKWQETLNVEHTSLSDLFLKHVVCTKHFKKSDYRNPISHHLNYTAIPCLDLEEDDTEYQIVELLEEVEEDGGLEEEEHLEYPSVSDENCDDGSYAHYIFPYESNIESSVGEAMELEDELQENEAVEMNLTDENLEETNMAEEEETINLEENDFAEEPPNRKRKIDSPIKEPVVIPDINLEVRTEVIPENKVIETSKPQKDVENPVERNIEKKPTITEEENDEISDDEDSNFKKLSRKELIKKLKNQSKKIADLEKKVKSYQKKMTVSMKTIKQLMLGNSDDDDDDDI